MGRIVIACYQPKDDREDDLLALVKTHLPVLRSEGLATEREPIVMLSASGVVVEVFEWSSPDAIRQAHSNPIVAEMWERFGEVCDYVPVGSLAEAEDLFSEFTPIDL